MVELRSALIAIGAWLGAIIERLSQGQSPMIALSDVCVDTDARRFGAVPVVSVRVTGDSPLSDPALDHLVELLHQGSREKPWEADLWEQILGYLPTRLPSPIAYDLIDRNIAITAIGHTNQEDAVLWRLSDQVSEARYRLASRRYVGDSYADESIEEVLHAFRDDTVLLGSLAQLDASDISKARLLAHYIKMQAGKTSMPSRASDQFRRTWSEN